MHVEFRVDALAVRADGVFRHDELLGGARDGVPARDILHDLRLARAQAVLLAKDLRLLGETVGQLEVAFEIAPAASVRGICLRSGAAATNVRVATALARLVGIVPHPIRLAAVAPVEHDKLDVLSGRVVSKDPPEATLADEEHEPQKVQRHERGRCQRVDAQNAHLIGEGTRKKPHVMQGIHDAAEEAVDKDRVDAAVARGLSALDHHEHDDHAVDRVENRGLPSRVLERREGQKQKRRDHEGERHAVETDDVEPHALHLP